MHSVGSLSRLYPGFYRNQQRQQQTWGSRFCLGAEWLQTTYFLGPSFGLPHCEHEREFH